MAKRRRQDSLRASWLARNSSNGIGRFLVQIPPGERKSGMPHSVEIPAPVKGRMTSASPIASCRLATTPSRSGADILPSCIALSYIAEAYRQTAVQHQPDQHQPVQYQLMEA